MEALVGVNLQPLETMTTHPLKRDTDADGLPDKYEVEMGLNPVDPADGNADEDGDLLTRGEEYALEPENGL